ncbi:plasmid pRiA4b ORF-3 family protein [Burkholderia sp. PAMC 26561]|uniref:plasmid pRiA4b ORF-3 family protein n=1 Tax=Burkholderia sp. PAMC 26561 TaxID=1795043 RepID=UPI0013C45BC2
MYRYDFGDDWHHDIHVEDVVCIGHQVSREACVIASAAAWPSEDVGSASGYQEMLSVLGQRAQ